MKRAVADSRRQSGAAGKARGKRSRATEAPSGSVEDPEAHLDRQARASKAKADLLAYLSLRPSVQAATTLRDYNDLYKPDDDSAQAIVALTSELVKQCDIANQGNLGRAEAMLLAQAHTLDAMFNVLARKAQRAELMDQMDSYTRLALKAQSQCRATLETLADIKNPHPVAFVQQANIAHGPQQVNNGAAATDGPKRARARETQTQQSKLLEKTDGERLDFGTASSAGQVDPSLETVEAINGPEDGGR